MASSTVVLLTGASGLLGTWLRRTVPAGVRVVSAVHRRRTSTDDLAVDLRDRAAVLASLGAIDADLVIHTAYARDEAAVVDATANVIEVAERSGAGVVHLSSDALFAGDGRPLAETARPDPVFDYGRWKADAEAVVRAAAPDAAIVRPSLILSLDPTDHVVERIRSGIAAGEPTTWFTDEFRQPARADDLARAVWTIAGLAPVDRAGVWHLPGPERLSRLAIADRAVVTAGLPAASIVGAPTPPHLVRPSDIHLTASRARERIGWDPSPVYPSAGG